MSWFDILCEMGDKLPEDKKIEQSISELDNYKKERFVNLYRSPELSGNISEVCDAAEISRSRYYQWLEEDKSFRQVMYEAKMEKCDEAEQELYRRGLEKDTTALIFWLKNNHPNYRQGDEGGTRIQNNYFNLIKTEKSEFE